MRFFTRTSIKRKQTLIITLTSGAALLLACLVLGTYEILAFRQAMVSNLSTLAEIVANNSTAALDFNDPKSNQETLSALQAEAHIVGAVVYTREGQIFAVYDRGDRIDRFVLTNDLIAMSDQAVM